MLIELCCELYFFHFFDFQEIKFRKDLQDMSRHIDPVTNEFIEGYSMLADMLEYPMDKYITEKEKNTIDHSDFER